MSVQILVSIEELMTLRSQMRFIGRAAPIISVCGWCPTKESNDKQLTAAGFKISHGICEACLEKEKRANDADQRREPNKGQSNER